jgi:hypothetical protein
MIKEEIYSIWAPEGGIWSKWAKPILFAYTAGVSPVQRDSAPADWGARPPSAYTDTGLVVELEGARGVLFGLRLAQDGYRPVPLYNACPQPRLPVSPDAPIRLGLQEGDEGANYDQPEPVVDVNPIVAALASWAEELRRQHVPLSAPPAFLLDWRRGGEGKRVRLGMFDNRSVIFPSDFPSAAFLQEQGIRTMVLVSETHQCPFDLATVLREWEAGGLEIKLQPVALPWSPTKLDLPVPSLFKRLSFWLAYRLGLQRNLSGGYGRIRRASG